MRRTPRTRALEGLVVVGFAVTLWSMTLQPWTVALAATTTGIITTFGAIALLYLGTDGSFTPWGLGRVDDRQIEIEARAARNAWFVITALLCIFLISAEYRPWELTANVLAIAVTLAGTGTLITSISVYESRI